MRTVEYTIVVKDENGNIISETKYSKNLVVALVQKWKSIFKNIRF